MPTNKSVTLVKGTIPEGTCFTDVQNLYDTFVNATSAYVDGNYSLFVYGPNTPSADDQDKPWIRTVGGFFDKVYVHTNGYWLSPHAVPHDSSERRLWVGTESSLLTYDGGGGGSEASTYSGPFWEVDREASGRFLMAAGATLDNGTVVQENTKGGENSVTLSVGNLPPHNHDLYYTPNSSGGGSLHTGEGNFVTGSQKVKDMAQSDATIHTSNPIEILPEYYGMWIIKRTARRYYTP